MLSPALTSASNGLPKALRQALQQNKSAHSGDIPIGGTAYFSMYCQPIKAIDALPGAPVSAHASIYLIISSDHWMNRSGLLNPQVILSVVVEDLRFV